MSYEKYSELWEEFAIESIKTFPISSRSVAVSSSILDAGVSSVDLQTQSNGTKSLIT